MISIHSKTLDYFKEKVDGFKYRKSGKMQMFTCPLCKKEPISCVFIPNTNFLMKCHSCNFSGDIFDTIKVLEPDKDKFSKNQLIEYIAKKYNLSIPENEETIEDLLEFYSDSEFDLVPIAKNDKIPIEKDWTNKSHKSIDEWMKWLETGINIGVKTGKISNITVIDVDTKPIPEEIDKIKGDCVIQETNRGFHLFYKYEAELSKTRIDKLKIDIENDGGQVVVYPSIVDGVVRKFSNIKPLMYMPKELKAKLLENVSKTPLKTLSEKLREDIKTEEFNVDITSITEGNRTNSLLRFGGILRKSLNLEQTENVLTLFNRHFCNPPLPYREIKNLVNSLDKYIKFDAQDLALKILDYLKIVGDAYSKEVQEVVREPKEKVDKALAFLLKEGYVIKARRRFHVIKKANWTDLFGKLDNEISLKIPYFNDHAVFQWGDMILLGSKAKWGKTTISMNIVKSFVQQGIKPYYICLETGSRYQKTAIQLGLKEGDFWSDFQSDPTKIELEKEAVTILDWLLIADKSQSDVVLKHFVEQLHKTKGLLIIFMQLKENGEWFAPNMVKQFPALASRYLYDDGSDGTTGKWILDVIREAKFKSKSASIPCQYDWNAKTLFKVGKKGVI